MASSNARSEPKTTGAQTDPDGIARRERLDEDLAGLYAAFAQEAPSEEARQLGQKLQGALDELRREKEPCRTRPEMESDGTDGA